MLVNTRVTGGDVGRDQVLLIGVQGGVQGGGGEVPLGGPRGLPEVLEAWGGVQGYLAPLQTISRGRVPLAWFATPLAPPAGAGGGRGWEGGGSGGRWSGGWWEGSHGVRSLEGGGGA